MSSPQKALDLGRRGTPRILILNQLSNTYLYVMAIVLIVACVRIALTYTTFNQTYDEPFHIACGTEWLDRGAYHYEALHPPLGRIAAAIGPFLAGGHSHGLKEALDEGNAILNSEKRYWGNLTLARLGELPLFLLASSAVWVWASRCFGRLAAFFSLLLFSSLPPVLAHGGLATTDIAITATCTWAFFLYVRFLEHRTLPSSLLLGLSIGLALVSKFSAILFLGIGIPVVTAAYFVCSPRSKQQFRLDRQFAMLILTVALVVFLVIWSSYRYTFTPVFSASELRDRATAFPHIFSRPGLVHGALTRIYVPAPQFLRGIGQALRRNHGENWSYLLGNRRDGGWWYFFPVVLAIKTPLGFLLLAIPGTAALLSRLRTGAWQAAAPALLASSVLLCCLPTRINIGVRHILPIYPLLSLAAGSLAASSVHLLHRARTVSVLVCVGWCCLSSALAHPDYLAYFNEIAAAHPERYVLNSDLDWGQDLGRLSNRLRQLHASGVMLSYFGTMDLTRAGLPAVQEIPCDRPLKGDVAISVTALYLGRVVWSACPERFIELGRTAPAERVGRSIFLYHFASPTQSVDP